jgi:hypothetical protein
MPTGLGDELLWLCPSLDDSPNDLSGNNNGGTYKNGTGTVVDSDPVYNGSRAYSFDGSDDYILTGTQAINSKQLSRSWSLWFKTNGQIGTVSYGLFAQRAYTGYGQDQSLYILRSNDPYPRRIQAAFDGQYTDGYNPPVAIARGDSSVDDSNWHHCTWVLDRSVNNLRVYIDGVLKGTDSVDVNAYQGNNNGMTFGSGQGRGGTALYYLNGFMDDIRRYDRPLTQQEIEHLASSRGILGGPGGTHIHRTLLGVG